MYAKSDSCFNRFKLTSSPGISPYEIRWPRQSRSKMRTAQQGGPTDEMADCEGNFAIHRACHLKDCWQLDVLLDSGASIECRNLRTDQTPLAIAVSVANDAAILTLLRRGANLEATCGPRKLTPILIAALNDDAERVLLLLRWGANPCAGALTNGSIQDYLFMTEFSLIPEARVRHCESVIAWLRQHNLSLVAAADRFIAYRQLRIDMRR